MQAGSNVPRRLEHEVLITSTQSTERKNMDTNAIETMFGRIGARVRVSDAPHPRLAGIDIQTDRYGEFFDIKVGPEEQVGYEVIDLRPDMSHLLLMARRPNEKQKFLCGHDERHWFVCAVPGASVSSVKAAMEALQPAEVRSAVQRRVKRNKNRLRRRNSAFVRQGEWYFIPVPQLTINRKLILKNEPLSRGWGSKPHMCQFLFRKGGERVWVCPQYPTGVDEKTKILLFRTNPQAKGWNWRQMVLEPEVYVRGRVWHSDHKTIELASWHRVLMNTERFAPGAQSVVFLD